MDDVIDKPLHHSAEWKPFAEWGTGQSLGAIRKTPCASRDPSYDSSCGSDSSRAFPVPEVAVIVPRTRENNYWSMLAESVAAPTFASVFGQMILSHSVSFDPGPIENQSPFPHAGSTFEDIQKSAGDGECKVQ